MPVLRDRDGSDDISLSLEDMTLAVNVPEPILPFEPVIDYSVNSELDTFSEDDLFNSMPSHVAVATDDKPNLRISPHAKNFVTTQMQCVADHTFAKFVSRKNAPDHNNDSTNPSCLLLAVIPCVLALDRFLAKKIFSTVSILKLSFASIFVDSFEATQHRIDTSHGMGICNMEKLDSSLVFSDIVQEISPKDEDIQASMLNSTAPIHESLSSDAPVSSGLQCTWSS